MSGSSDRPDVFTRTILYFLDKSIITDCLFTRTKSVVFRDNRLSPTAFFTRNKNSAASRANQLSPISPVTKVKLLPNFPPTDALAYTDFHRGKLRKLFFPRRQLIRRSPDF
uniref:(northern house mosquito) hypothetical protein n=1 Tax=Culex pipiens TaxID=7175 RepID=A0A8D8DE69_CULPI